MRRDHLEQAMRTPCQIIGGTEVIIEETARLADAIEGVAGEFSPCDDLCVGKPCSFREKDRDVVRALLDGQLVDLRTISSRLLTVRRRHRSAAQNASRWLSTA